MALTFPGRIEALATVPSGGAAVSATNSGGGPTTVTVPAGDVYLTTAGGVSSLITVFQTQLNATRDPAPGTWSVSFSQTTGQVTIDCTSGDKITRHAGGDAWDAGACTSTTIAGDGYVEFTVLATGQYRALGFSPSGAVSINVATIDFGIYLKGGATPLEYSVVESGTEPFTSTYAVDDKFKVDRTGTTIRYYKNDVLVYTSAFSSTGALMIDSAYFTASTTMCAIRLYDNGVRTALTWGTTTNTTATMLTWSLSWTSTELRDRLGFTANIVTVNAPQTGADQSDMVWFPDSPLNVDDHPSMVPLETDARSSESPTKVSLTLVGTGGYAHTNIRYQRCPVDRIREISAVLDNASLEVFYRNCIVGMGSTWFSPGTDLQVWWNNAGVLELLGSDGPDNDGNGVSGWRPSAIPKFSGLARPSQEGWVGAFDVTFPRLVTDG